MTSYNHPIEWLQKAYSDTYFHVEVWGDAIIDRIDELHDVYEAVAGQSIDLANFRRKMLASGQLEDTGDKLRVGRNRPATVYRYTMDVLRQSTWSDARDRHDFDVRETQDDVLSALTTI